MATVIECERWNFDPDAIETGFQPNSGQLLTTEAVQASMKELRARPEMAMLVEMIKASPQFASGKQND